MYKRQELVGGSVVRRIGCLLPLTSFSNQRSLVLLRGFQSSLLAFGCVELLCLGRAHVETGAILDRIEATRMQMMRRHLVLYLAIDMRRTVGVGVRMHLRLALVSLLRSPVPF